MTVEQIAPAEFRTALQDIFRKEWTPEFVRARWDGGPDRAPDAWAALRGVGLAEIFLARDGEQPVVSGELRLVLAEEVARVLFPLPVAETLLVIGPILARSTQGFARDWLGRLAEGNAFGALMLEDGKPVDEADTADFILAVRDDRFVLVERERYRVEPVTTQDRARRAYRVEFATEDARALDVGPELIDEAWTSMVKITAARLLGVADVLFERTVGYVSQRQQFGQPVGAFQSIQHRIADVFVALELARALVYEPADAVNAGRRPIAISASAAKVQAATAERLANREALQLHGAMGFSWEYDLHFWLKHGKALEQEYGTVSAHLEVLAESCFEAAKTEIGKEI
ncbi:acyl-CoA dehydrogenase family protein [Nocardia sp. NPDC059239]|uniref:acyl-CoA dehydrogenase family protein n=1 Tax=unclassified Nocardia TaxID=2637762 RepID=UPI0036A788C9